MLKEIFFFFTYFCAMMDEMFIYGKQRWKS